jgi:hypothetical protein
MTEKTYKVLIARGDVYDHADLNSSERMLLLAAFDGQSLLKTSGSLRSYNRITKSLREKNMIQEVPPGISDYEAPPPSLEDPTLPDDMDAGLVQEFEALAADEPERLVFTRDELNAGRDARFVLFCDLYPGADFKDRALREAWIALEKDNRAMDRNKLPEIVHLMPRILSAAQHETFWHSKGQSDLTDAAEWINREQYQEEVYNAEYGDDRPEALSDREMTQKAEEYFAKISALGHNAVAPQANEPPVSCYKRMKARYRQALDNQRLGVNF